MDKEIARRKKICEQAENAEWEDVIPFMSGLEREQRAFLKAHPPGLVKALWAHFEATRDKCGCTSASHERADCPAKLIERLLLDEEAL